MKTISHSSSVIFFGVTLMMIISCNKVNYPAHSKIDIATKQATEVVEMHQQNAGTSPSGLYQPGIITKSVTLDSPVITSNEIIIYERDSNTRLNEINDFREESIFVEEKSEDVFPTKRDVNEMLFASILSLLLLPTGFTFFFSLTNLKQIIRIRKAIKNDQSLAIYSKKANAAFILSIIGIVLSIASFVLIVFLIANTSFFSSSYVLFGP
jgi:hypothetical protein